MLPFRRLLQAWWLVRVENFSQRMSEAAVSPHTSSNSTYVPGHYATNPNNTQLDNFGTRGNYNPYTGTTGTRSPRY